MAKKATNAEPTEEALEAVEKALEIDFGAELEGELAASNLDGDATDDALAAIEDAANELQSADDIDLDFDVSDLTPKETALGATAGVGAAAATASSSTSKRTQINLDDDDLVKPASPPANDDARRSVSSIVYKMQQKPSKKPFVWATLFSMLWVAGGAALAFWLYGEPILEIRDAAGVQEYPGLIAIAVGVIVPIFLFFAFAAMVYRANDMRLAARSMTEAAVRLIEPEDMARDKVFSVGQAVRREVTAMSDGVEKALSRASELEVWFTMKSIPLSEPTPTTKHGCAAWFPSCHPSARVL
ncbi:MAG: hypothetical protein AAF141_04000 [Pseudomonadota bacterium]